MTQEISLVETKLRHKPLRKPSSLVHSLFPTTNPANIRLDEDVLKTS